MVQFLHFRKFKDGISEFVLDIANAVPKINQVGLLAYPKS